ncbi:ATP-dependent DNA ligase [Methanolobus halotolerans]|uniref:DNA ligase n=1 Tax=Methanolobus halotolerans TaxID=2052935 RepID=A0A4E0QZB5_9EURY|nr:ATP-dependent DNA ligase [Methanolobus halotolerans]TGC09114.1 DNA ligase [Methanolobus halotolerans]
MGNFGKIAEVYSDIEKMNSHKEIVETLASFLKKLEPEDAGISAYFALGNIGPKFEDIDLGIGERLGIRAISSAYDVSKEDVSERFSELGDLGDVASKLNERQRSSMSIRDVFGQLIKIRDSTGDRSQIKKVSILSKLLEGSTPEEAKYIMRIVLGQLRLGFGEQFLIEAMALAFTDDRNNAGKIEDTYNICSDIGELAQSLAEQGITSLDSFSIKVGRPVRMMLAKRVDTIEKLNKIFPGEMAAEEKYDGERVQVHIDGDNIRAFSRRLEDISKQFPDVIEALRDGVRSEEIVIDGEIVAYKDSKIRPFQELMQRRRKHDVEKYIDNIPVAVFFFDVIYLEGRSLLQSSYPERRKQLEKNLKVTDKIKLSRRVVSPKITVIQDFFDECIKKGLEGIIIKSTSEDSVYQPGKRGWLWVKWKKEYAEGIRETFDLVVVGIYYGKGKRKTSFGALLCAVLNKEKGQYETFTKVGTGFTDDDLDELNTLLEEHLIDKVPANVVINKSMEPDRYVDPSVIIEVLGSQITRSPGHTAGKSDGKKGFALRFPRFLRTRYDKGPAEATTVREISDMG